MSWQSEKAHGEEIAYRLAPLGRSCGFSVAPRCGSTA